MPKIAHVEPTATYLLDGGNLVLEPYNDDITLIFGTLDGRVVIKDLKIKGYYDAAVVQQYVENAHANNMNHNCKYCDAQEKKLREKIARALNK